MTYSMYRRLSTAPGLCGVLALAFTGCSLSPTVGPSAEPGTALRGNVHGGQQPVRHAHVYLFAANTTGYGKPSVSLLQHEDTGDEDEMGAYVSTDEDGNFSISNRYVCEADSQVYLLTTGGDPGAGDNDAVRIMAILGSCPATGSFVGVLPYLIVNEVTTVAAAYAMSGFATDATHVSSPGTPLARTAMANAFANAANLASLSTGGALATTPGGNGIAPQRTVNTIANILASCVNTDGHSSPACANLFHKSRSSRNHGVEPTDTATAAINIAHNPGLNVQALYFLPPPVVPFAPGLISVPNDFMLPVTFSGGGLDNPYALALDSQGNVWTTNLGNGSVSLLSSNGVPVSPDTGFKAATSAPVAIAIDSNDHAWVADAVSNSVVEYSPSGVLLSPAPIGFTGGGLQVPQAVAVDANGNAWVASYLDTLSEFSAAGSVLSPAIGFSGGGLNGPGGIAADSDGSVWVANTSSSGSSGISKFASSGAPLSPVNGFLGGGLNVPFAIAVDAAGDAWVANKSGDSLTELASSGEPISPATGYTGGGLLLPFALAMDGAGNAWVANYLGNDVSEFDNSGNALSPTTGYTASTLVHPQALAVDSGGNVWIANSTSTSVTELIGAAVPVTTPLAVGVKNHQLGSRP
jgi:streptogramin lyase